MKTLIIVLLLTACSTTIEIRPDGTVIVEGPRQATVITDKVAISTSKMLMDDQTILALTQEVIK